jgi:predicted ATPase/class 3 adenylate cyclase
MAELPSGTVTFLFTDLEGSTRLWEEHPDAMPQAVARHDQIVRAAISRHDGRVVKSTGDGVHAVFVTAARALYAAIDAQRALGSEPWGALGELRVRMGIHSGAAEWHDGDYPGQTVNKAARVMSVANGGQVVVSLATAELVRDRLGTDVGLVDLGEHRLRDLSRAERLFQVRAVGLREAFPPLRSMDVLPNNLQVQLTSFIGRESEIAAVAELLESKRLVTLTGAAGCGKTRLALQVGVEVLGRFGDGVWLVDLAAVTDSALVLGAIASSLNIREATAGGMGFTDGAEQLGARALEEVVLEYLRSRNALVILDNCEHLLDACSSFVDRSLHACAGLRILATSREPLGVTGEATRRVPSLDTPDISHLPAAEDLRNYESVRLFVDRASLQARGFVPSDTDLVTIAHICARVDGIPLAIVLAAGRVKVLAPADIAQRLDHQFVLLTGGGRTALERHQTLRGALDWSWELLAESEQLLLARLSVFTRGFSLEAVEAICADASVPADKVLDLLQRLVDRSLVETEATEAGVRYRLLESIRQYGREQLVTFGEAEVTRAHHRDFFTDFAVRAQRGLWGPEQGQWLTTVTTDLENIRAAITWSLVYDEHEVALRIVTSLDNYWMGAPKNNREGLLWLDQCLAAASDVPDALRARALGATCSLTYFLYDYERALDAGRAALALYREIGNTRAIALVLSMLALVARGLERRADAESYSDEAVTVARQSGFDPVLGGALVARMFTAEDRGDRESAEAACHEVLASRDRQLPVNVALVLTGLGYISFAEGQYFAAANWFQESADIAATTGASTTFDDPARGLAAVAVALGDFAQARQIREQTLDQLREIGRAPAPDAFWPDVLAEIALGEGNPDQAELVLRRGLEERDLPIRRPWFIGLCVLFARIALAQGDHERAIRLLGASEALREQLDAKGITLQLPPPDTTIAEVRSVLGDDTFSTAWSTGRALSYENAVTYALQPTRTASPAHQPDNTQP